MQTATVKMYFGVENSISVLQPQKVVTTKCKFSAADMFCKMHAWSCKHNCSWKRAFCGNKKIAAPTLSL